MALHERALRAHAARLRRMAAALAASQRALACQQQHIEAARREVGKRAPRAQTSISGRLAGKNAR